MDNNQEKYVFINKPQSKVLVVYNETEIGMKLICTVCLKIFMYYRGGKVKIKALHGQIKCFAPCVLALFML